MKIASALVAGLLLFATGAAAQMGPPSLPGVPTPSVGAPGFAAPLPALGAQPLAVGAPTRAVAPLPVTGPAQGALRQLNPPTPLEQVIQQSMQRMAPLPAPPQAATERWVPERRVYAPEFGRDVVVPGHSVRSDQPYATPPLTVREVPSGRVLVAPGAYGPAADPRQGP